MTNDLDIARRYLLRRISSLSLRRKSLDAHYIAKDRKVFRDYTERVLKAIDSLARATHSHIVGAIEHRRYHV